MYVQCPLRQSTPNHSSHASALHRPHTHTHTYSSVIQLWSYQIRIWCPVCSCTKNCELDLSKLTALINLANAHKWWMQISRCTLRPSFCSKYTRNDWIRSRVCGCRKHRVFDHWMLRTDRKCRAKQIDQSVENTKNNVYLVGALSECRVVLSEWFKITEMVDGKHLRRMVFKVKTLFE